ncbi:MAG: carbohydrate ABC transporter permease [Treponema sp.]|jgi:putative aldouronate transport system permease protein|nr:carbohydrate ABC transporter permease [Treponema sp.]
MVKREKNQKGVFALRLCGICSGFSPGYALLLAFLLFYAFICLMPFWYVLVTSLSDPLTVKEGTFKLLPSDFSLQSYKIVFRDQRFFNGLFITILRTIIGSLLGILVQAMAAYALSRKYLKGRSIFRKLLVFTILFNGGIIPNYLVMRNLHLLNTFPVMIFPMVFNPWNIVLLISFFTVMPDAIEESAKLDGANDFVIFYRLAVPLALPAIATIILFIAVRHWNELMDGVIYIHKDALKPMQVYLYELVVRTSMGNMIEPTEQAITSVSIQTAVIFASSFPIIVLYPFLQRYFVKGIMIGAVKG